MGLEILSTESKKVTEIRVTTKSNEVFSIGIDQLPDYLQSFVVKTFVTEQQYKKDKDTKTNIEQLLLKRALEFELQPLIKGPLKNESIKNISKSSSDHLAKFITIVVGECAKARLKCQVIQTKTSHETYEGVSNAAKQLLEIHKKKVVERNTCYSSL